MIFARKDLFTLSYYKAQPYTASSNGTRLRLTKEFKEDGEEKIPYFKLCLWPEPFAFHKTPEEKKTYFEFEFSEEGILEIINFLNEKIGDKS